MAVSELSDEKKWFQVLEIEVNRQCNLKCEYCPQSKSWYRKPESKMSSDLFEHILEMTSRINFAGRLSFHHYNEPLLRKDLHKLVGKARNKLPDAFFVLYTNGVLLSDKRYQVLLDAGIDRFYVSNHKNIKISERPYQEIQYPGEFVLSGRAGIINNLKQSSNSPCYAPSEMMIVRHNGDVVLCHEDASSKHIIGSLETQTLEEVWFGGKFIKYRELLEKGKRYKANGICSLCDNFLHPLPDTAI
ncbi:MAG: radical SAM protein [Colwellia sp.]